ncbi:hypothetical protein BGW36DRAFT_359190 [Talaromyces proteolyticus]|uniref:Uncharacterized protein n=1 Tax=Talaromyces proteolyticus TaxID=1131652 RepID=A0AAD4Q087_9EURO|nr:uncharacterized protein BGW36DRAFT_359190 [Talaromyces proteolyticus]KAH8697397.1 hypothetical protein BGW36DRAFT_359190 [Talaromyces proteolyticus]
MEEAAQANQGTITSSLFVTMNRNYFDPNSSALYGQALPAFNGRLAAPQSTDPSNNHHKPTVAPSNPSSRTLTPEQPAFKVIWDYIHALDIQMHNFECRSLMQCWVVNELGLTLDYLFQHLRLIPNLQVSTIHDQMITLLDYLRTTSPAYEWYEKMKERADEAWAQYRATGINERFLLHCPPCCPSLLSSVHPLWAEGVQTAPELPCSIAIHRKEPVTPVVRLPPTDRVLREEPRQSTKGDAINEKTAEYRVDRIYPVIPLSSASI